MKFSFTGKEIVALGRAWGCSNVKSCLAGLPDAWSMPMGDWCQEFAEFENQTQIRQNRLVLSVGILQESVFLDLFMSLEINA